VKAISDSTDDSYRWIIENDAFKPVHFTTLTYAEHHRGRGFKDWCRFLRETAQLSEKHFKVWASRGSNQHLHLISSTEDGSGLQFADWGKGNAHTKPYHDGVPAYLFAKHGHDSIWRVEQGEGRIFCPKMTGCKRSCIHWD